MRTLLTLSVLAGFAGPGTARAQDTAPVPVTTSEVIHETLTTTVPAAGTIHSRQTARITAGMGARLAWIAEPGDQVGEGEPVARFDCSMVELRFEEQQAIADREEIRHDALRAEVSRLEKAGLATSTMQLDRTRADRDLAAGEMRIAAVRVRQIRNELGRCVERAPFSGVVTQQQVRPGTDVARGEWLAAMTNVDQLEVRASVPVRYLPRMRIGSVAQVELPEMAMDGVLRTAVPAADSASQTFEVRIDLPDEAAKQVAAGQLVSIQLPLQTPPALTVPRDAIVLNSDGAFVMRLTDDDRVEKVAVVVADSSGERVPVRGALKVGDRVAVQGAEALADGSAIAVLAGT